jgi:hydroxypyruvate reductase
VAIARAAIAAVDPARLVARALEADPLPPASRLSVVAAGKAATRMLAPILAADRPLTGIVATAAASETSGDVEWYAAGHPTPDASSVAAGRRALELANACAARRDVLIVLLSGGASSMLAVPAGGVSLEAKIDTTRMLLAAGAPIHELNAVRKHLSAIKGGRLGAAAGSTLTLALSDVVGPIEDDLAVIGSGPTAADPTTFGEALAALSRWRLADRVPREVREHLTRGARGEVEETIKPGDPRLARATLRIAGGRRDAVAGAEADARGRGYAVETIAAAVVGDARAAGPALVERALSARRAIGRRVCLLASGETTVAVRGRGRGGRNQELVLSAARALATTGCAAAIVSVGTDGVDGPTDAAGSVADSTTLARAASRGLGAPERFLDDNDSYTFFDALGDLVRTGPTGTNVGDLCIVLVH